MGGTLEADLDLLAPGLYPRDLPRLEPLRLAPQALQEWFRDLLDRLGFDQYVVQSVGLHFHVRDNPYECPAVRATITAHTGRTYTGRVRLHSRLRYRCRAAAQPFVAADNTRAPFQPASRLPSNSFALFTNSGVCCS